jgi:squalene synthase HpnC
MAQASSFDFSETTWIERDWQRFGPSSATLDLARARDYCRALATQHYENFSVASFLIPAKLREHFYTIYAYCRWSDHLADESGSPGVALERLAWWQSQLDDCFQGQASHPVMVALRETIRDYALDKSPFKALLSAFRQDQSTYRYETDAELLDYCARSANPVGRILLALAKASTPDNQEKSDRICTGLQLINFCQDVPKDAKLNRIYFPRQRWQAYGLTEGDFLEGRATVVLCRAMLDWAREISNYFYEGWELTYAVPTWLSRDIRLFAGGGLILANKIVAADGNVWSTRIDVSRWNKTSLLIRALLTSQPPKRPSQKTQ